MKRFRVKGLEGTQHVEANWFRISWLSNTGHFYRGLRKVAWFQRVYYVVREEAE